MSRLVTGAATDKGRVRPTNEDRLMVTPHLIAVADGMGGHLGGEVAARTAVETLLRAFGAKRSSEDLMAAVQEANSAIWEESHSAGELRGMGTTLTAMALVSDGGVERLTLVNVGDSRAYLYDRGTLTQLTQDHSLVEEMVRDGELTPDEAAIHPHRHILTRALGIDRGVEIDAWRLEPTEGDRILLCSDGLTNELTEDDIADTLGSEPDPESAAAELVRLAIEHGGNDNVTAVVIDIADVGVPSSDAVDLHLASALSIPPAGVEERRPLRGTAAPRKPGRAGSTEGLTGYVPVIGAAAAAAAAGAAGSEAGGLAGATGAGSATAEGAGGTVAAGGSAAAAITGAVGATTGQSAGGAGQVGTDGSGQLPDTGPPTRAIPRTMDTGSGTTMLPVVPKTDRDHLPTYGRSPDRAPDLRTNDSYVEGSAIARNRRDSLTGTSAGEAGRRDDRGAEALDGAGEDRHGRPVVLVAPKRKRRSARAERVMTVRVAIFALLLVGVLGGSAGVVGWYVQNSYYVGISGNEVVIYHGRPGGLLWFGPSVIQHTGIFTKQVIPPLIPILRAGVEETTLQAAQSYVSKLSEDKSAMILFSPTTTVPPATIPSGVSTSTTTTSSVPPNSIVTQTTPPPPTSSTPTTGSTTTTVAPTTTTTVAPTTTSSPPTTTTSPPHKHHHKAVGG